MPKLFKNIRFYVLLASLTWSVIAYVGINTTTRLTEVYALTAFAYLYTTLLIGPLVYTFTALPFRGYIYRARRAVGVSTCYFALLHAYLAFFKELGGFAGLGFLNIKYLIAISLSATALAILCVLSLTSFDRMVTFLTFRRWKTLHRFAYVAGIFVLIHALMLGTDFIDLGRAIPQLVSVAVGFLFFLEARRIDVYLKSKFSIQPQFGFITTVFVAALVVYVGLIFLPSNTSLSLSIHSQHIVQPTTVTNGQSMPRFNVSFTHPDNVQSRQNTVLNFEIVDAATGNPIQFFSPVYEKVMHLVIVNSELTYYQHIHPEQTARGFSIATQFPKEDIYHVYINFQPVGSIEQQFGFTLPVGSVSQPVFSTAQPDTNLTKTFGQYEVTLAPAEDKISFTFKDAVTKQAITNLKPYLGAFGHLVMINKDTFEYIHVHPTNLTAPAQDATAGPTVDFLPMSLYGPLKPGVYRLFAQFNPEGNVQLVDFTIKVN